MLAVHSSSVAPIPLSPSQQVKNTAEQFIDQFSHTQEDISLSSPWKSLLTESQKLRVIKGVQIYERNKKTSDKTTEDEWLKGSGFYRLGQGHHHVVWGNQWIPGVVFKKMRTEDALTQQTAAYAAHQFASKQCPFWCRVPVGMVVDLPEGSEALSVYVEEQLPIGMGMDENKEFWSRIFIHLQSPDCSLVFKDNLFNLVQQISALVETIGFWDAGEHNLPEISLDGKYVCATDFEKVTFCPQEKVEGMRRLARLFCHEPFIEYFSTKYRENDLEIEFQSEMNRFTKDALLASFDWAWKCAQQQCKARQEAIQKYDELGWIDGPERVSHIFDATGMTESEFETARGLTSHFQDCLKGNREFVLTRKRYCYIQPYSKNYDLEIFSNVVNKLKEQDLIVSWRSDYDNWLRFDSQNINYTAYEIWF